MRTRALDQYSSAATFSLPESSPHDLIGWIGLGFGLSETMTNGRYGNDVAVGWVTAQGPCKVRRAPSPPFLSLHVQALWPGWLSLRYVYRHLLEACARRYAHQGRREGHVRREARQRYVHVGELLDNLAAPTLIVLCLLASEADGYTLIEFTKNLTSGDPFDVNSSWFAVRSSS